MSNFFKRFSNLGMSRLRDRKEGCRQVGHKDGSIY